MVVRGTSDQLAFAQWLFDELDKPANLGQTTESSLYKYQAPGETEDSARVFYLPRPSESDLQKIATQIRTAANVQRAYFLSGPRALVLRGSSEQIALGERLIKELDPTDFPQ